MSQIVYAICGKACHGKDTIADYLVENYGFKKMSFAEPLKEACQVIFGFDNDQVYGDKKETIDEFWGCTPRKTLQYVGTELFRHQIGEILPKVGSNIWAQSAIRRIKSHFEENPNTPVVISDLRFENEHKCLTESGLDYKLFKVFNPRVQDIDGVTSQTHASENLSWVDGKCSYVFTNNGTLKDLYTEIQTIMEPQCETLFDICIYHEGCPDGECSKFLYKKFLSKYPNHSCEFIGMKAGGFINMNYTDKKVLLLDVSFRRNKAIKVAKVAKRITILDHHKSVQEDLVNLPFNVDLNFDILRSGCQITWDYFFGCEADRPYYVDLVGDRDFWKFKLPHTKAFHAYMSVNDMYNEKGFKEIDGLMLNSVHWENFNGIDQIMKEGEIYLKVINSEVKKIASKHIKCTRTRDGKTYKVYLVGSPEHLVSEVAAELYQDPECDIVMVLQWSISDDTYKISLRTNKDEIDVSEIASALGGGGHAKASGFKTYVGESLLSGLCMDNIIDDN